MSNPNTAKIKVLMILEKDTDGSFLLTCPQLGCIFVQEETEEDAIKHGVEAIDTYIQLSLENGHPIPDDIIVSRRKVKSVKQPRKVVPMKDFELTRSYASV